MVDYLDKTGSTFITKLDKCLDAIFYKKEELRNQELLLQEKKSLVVYTSLIIAFVSLLFLSNY